MGSADLVVREWIRVSISWTSKSTRESGVDRSSEVSVGLLVAVMRLLANRGAEKVGERRVVKSIYEFWESEALLAMLYR